MTRMLFVIATAAAFVPLVTTSAQSADLRLQVPQPYVQRAPAPADDCAYVHVVVHNWNQDAVFRVTAKGGSNLKGGIVQMPARLKVGANRICIPRALFNADAIEICIGETSRDNSNSRLIQGRWMQLARANLQRGNLVNPESPMEFRYNGPSMAPGMHQRRQFRPYRHHQQGYRPMAQQENILPLVAGVALGALAGRR